MKSKFADYFAPFLDDITHNIHARFDVYTVDDHLLSKFQIMHPANWPKFLNAQLGLPNADTPHSLDPLETLRSYGNEKLEQLLLKSPHEGIGNYFTDDEIVQMKAEWPGFKVAMNAEESPSALY